MTGIEFKQQELSKGAMRYIGQEMRILRNEFGFLPLGQKITE
jgi:hypothetical protein